MNPLNKHYECFFKKKRGDVLEKGPNGDIVNEHMATSEGIIPSECQS